MTEAKRRKIAQKYVNRGLENILAGKGIADEYDALINRDMGPLADALAALWRRSGVFNGYYVEHSEE